MPPAPDAGDAGQAGCLDQRHLTAGDGGVVGNGIEQPGFLHAGKRISCWVWTVGEPGGDAVLHAASVARERLVRLSSRAMARRSRGTRSGVAIFRPVSVSLQKMEDAGSPAPGATMGLSDSYPGGPPAGERSSPYRYSGACSYRRQLNRAWATVVPVASWAGHIQP